jgi:TonB family protein
MPHRRIAACNGLFIVLALMIWPHPAMAQDSPSCQPQLELIPPPPQQEAKSPVDIQVEVRSGTQGVNFRPYLRRLTASITHHLLLTLPESVANGAQGTVVIRVQMQKDGSLSKDALSISCTSGIKEMDAAAQSAVHSAAPFEQLPQAYGGSDLVLLFRISYRYVPSHPSRRT